MNNVREFRKACPQTRLVGEGTNTFCRCFELGPVYIDAGKYKWLKIIVSSDKFRKGRMHLGSDGI